MECSNVSFHQRESNNSRDIEYQGHFSEAEEPYQLWWDKEQIMQSLRNSPDDTSWNIFVCIMVLVSIVLKATDLVIIYYDFFDIFYNVIYAIHVLGIAYNLYVEETTITFSIALGFTMDILSYSHYLPSNFYPSKAKLLSYYLRLHRPFRYLWALNDYNLKSSVLGTALKYCYIFFVLRITWALIWMQFHEEPGQYNDKYMYNWQRAHEPQMLVSSVEKERNISKFLKAVYLVNKMFIPIGPSKPPHTDTERIICLLVMITGCLAVSGCAVASLSLAIGIYMRPEEKFRARTALNYATIMQQGSDVPASLREKVQTFYKIYWHKQKAVSATELLPAFPPWISSIVYTDIYFNATQNSRILCDLSYQFLCEVVKSMQTLHYIPGDTIIKRTTRKSCIIYISYGDVEMLTAEDDSTAMLRMSRGTVLGPCAGCPPAGCGRAHVDIRAATFCTAQVLKASDLWRTAFRFGRSNGQAALILDSFYEHFERVKRHYFLKIPEKAKYKSSIKRFKRNLMDLKEARDKEGNLLLAQTDTMLEIAGCYMMRNQRVDSSLTDESDAICLRSTFPCILQPRSVLQTIWNSFVCCLILVVCFTHPYFIAYKEHVPLQFHFYDYVVTCIYLLDIFVYLSTGANVEDGVAISLRQTASQQIRSHWFVLDVVATMPVFEFIGNGRFAGMNKVLRLHKVFRVLKSMEDDWVYYSNFLRFFSYSLLLFLACYLVAALQQAFMCFYFNHCSVTNFTHQPFWAHVPPDDASIRNSLSFGLYWAASMTTFTAHKETGSLSNADIVLYTMLLLEICLVLHLFIDAVYSATIMVTSANREDYDACITDVKNFMVKNNVEPVLRQRFITYLQLCWYTDKGYSMTNKKGSIYHDLPPHVYQDIVNRQRSKYIICIPFMKYLNKEDLKTISTKAVVFCTSPNEIVLNTGDICNEMYVIKHGICEVVDPDTKQVVHELRARNYFGVLECLLRMPTYYTVHAVTHVQLFSISRKYLLNGIKVPQIKDAIEFAKKQSEFSRLQVRRQPFLRYKPPAPVQNVERFRLPRKHEQDHAFLQPFKRLGFLSVLRYVFPRFTIRPDSEYLIRTEWCRAFCALLIAMIVPGYPYFEYTFVYIEILGTLLDWAAYLDIVQRMFVGYYNERGTLVYHPLSTAGRYIRGAFIVDLFACLPTEKLRTVIKELYADRYRIAVSHQYLMMNRLVQLYRLPGAVRGLERYMRRDIALVIKSTPIFLGLLNVMTCLMVFYSVNIYLMHVNTADIVLQIVPRNDFGGSWVDLFQGNFRFNLTESPWNLHLACYFWVVFETTTTGYNTLNPSNFNIMKILFIGMVVAAMITTYYSVRIISIRSNVNNPLASFQQHMKDMAAFMRKENLSAELQSDVLSYYGCYWNKTGGQDYRYILKLCDQITLRTDAILHIYGPTFAMCPILAQCETSLLRIIGRAVRSVHFLKNTRIVEKDDVITDLCFVDFGVVELVFDESDASESIKLTKGSIFGDLDGNLSYRSPVLLTSNSKVQLLQINATAFINIIRDFPDVIETLKAYRPNNENYVLGNLDKESSSFKTTCQTTTGVQLQAKGVFRYLHLKNSFVQWYLIVIPVFCIYGDLYNAGFQDNRILMILTLYLLDIAFCLKFIMVYVTQIAYKTTGVRRFSLAVKRYCKVETKYDIISCIPLELLCFTSTKHRGMLFSFLRLNRLLRVVTVYAGLKRQYERVSIDISLTTICSVFVWFTLLVHGAACLWHFIGYVEELKEPKSSWFYKNDGSSWCNNMYLCSLYFVLTTCTQNGVGDIMPKKKSEVVFASILQIVSIMLFMIYVGEVSNIIQYQSYRSFDFYCKYLELQEFLRNNRVSKNLVKLVNRYSLHLWRESRGVQVPHFLKTAPHCLRLRLMSATFIHHLEKNEIFKDCEPAFLRQLVGCLRLYTYNVGIFVVRENEITNSMYLIHTGEVLESKEEHIGTKRFYTGDCFGQLQGLTKELPYTHSYRTITKCQILTLRLSDWENLMKHFPQSMETIYKYHNFDDGPPASEMKSTNFRGKKERKVTITNRNDESSLKDNARTLTSEPNRKVSTSGRKFLNSEQVAQKSTNKIVSNLHEKEKSSIIINSDDPKHESIASCNNLPLTDTKKSVKYTKDDDIPATGKDDHIKIDPKILDLGEVSPLVSTETLQSSKESRFSNLKNSLSSNIESLLNMEEHRDTFAQPSTLYLTKDDESIQEDERQISEIKVSDVDPVQNIDMKTVDEYILKRQDIDSIVTAQANEGNNSVHDIKQTQDDAPSSSRGNTSVPRVRYKDYISDDTGDEGSSIENKEDTKTIAIERNLLLTTKKEDSEDSNSDAGSKDSTGAKKLNHSKDKN